MTSHPPSSGETSVTQYIVRRVLVSVPLLIGITFAIFLLVNIMPGDPILAIMTGETRMSEEQIERARERLGLNQPLPVRYVRWLGEILRGNFGSSFITGRPVLEVLLRRIPPTLELMGVSLLFSIVVGMALGILSALRQYSVLDYILTVLGFAGVSVPVFFTGMLLIYVFAIKLHWLPTSGIATPGEPFSLVDNLRHLLMPALAIGLLRTAVFMRYTRASMLEKLQLDFVRTARAKGLSEWVVVVHTLRNALIPIITVIGLNLPVLIGGAVIIETLFQWPGMGLTYITAVNQRDYPMIMGFVLLTSIFVLLSNLLTDICYAFADPRVAYE